MLALLGSPAATNSQAFNGTAVNAGASAIALIPNGGGTTNLNLGTITRNLGGTVDFNVLGSGAIQTSSGTASTILTDANGAAYATVLGGSDWAAKNAGNANVVGLSTLGGYAATLPGSLSGNADVASGVNTTLAANASIGSLRFNVNEAARSISTATTWPQAAFW